MRASDEPIDMQALFEALPEGRWLTEEEVVDLLEPVVDSPVPFRTTDARSAIDGLLAFGLILQDGKRYVRPAPAGQTVPGRLSIIRRNDT